MIRVTRPIAKAPAEWLSQAADERREAIAAYQRDRKVFLRRQKKVKKKKLEFTFTFNYQVYRADPLKDALNRFYHRKCAYCEGNVEGTGPIAVEHYRPKGAVIEDGKRIKPAYYWLASDWENLLPSCTDCNSRRGQAMGPNQKKVTRGKGNYFPLEPGSRRARTPGREAVERPLLLHPERDDPALCLEFLTDDAGAGLIRPAEAAGVPSPKGVSSIEVYALDRPVLQQERQKTAAKLLSHLRNTLDAWSDHKDFPTEQRFLERYQRNLDDLKNCYLDPSQAYSGMSRQIVKARLPGVLL